MRTSSGRTTYSLARAAKRGATPANHACHLPGRQPPTALALERRILAVSGVRRIEPQEKRLPGS